MFVWPPCCDVLRHVGCCWLKFENGQIWANNTQHVATCCNRVAKRTQHVAPNNVAICWVGMLRSFGRGLTCVRIFWMRSWTSETEVLFTGENTENRHPCKFDAQQPIILFYSICFFYRNEFGWFIPGKLFKREHIKQSLLVWSNQFALQELHFISSSWHYVT